MSPKSLNELDYNLELDKVSKEIIKNNSKKVLIQLPDGLKPYATQIVDELKIRVKNKSEILIYMDSCFGACDIPLETEKLGVDMIVQFGHSNWNFDKSKNITLLS